MISWIKEVIKNEYHIIKLISKNNNSEIKLIQNNSTGKKLVLKELNGDCEVYKKLININHKNLPIIYEAISENNNSIILEEYIDGITVGDILETGLYTDEGAYEVIRQLCNALNVLHDNNIIHRDIKPENIMITNDGDVKLIDYNIARIKKPEENRKDTRVLGTIGFAAPEQFGIAKSDERTDIYALGILINVMLTGEHPSKKICTGRWKKIVQKCTSINPNDRYRKVEDIIN